MTTYVSRILPAAAVLFAVPAAVSAAPPADRPVNAQSEAVVRALLAIGEHPPTGPRLIDRAPAPVPSAADATDRREVAVTARAPSIYPPIPPAGRFPADNAPPARRPEFAVPADPQPSSPLGVAAIDATALDRPTLSDEQYREILLDLRLPNGLVLDRDSDRQTVSAAATGLVQYALAVLATRGVGDAGEVADRLREAVEVTLAANPPRNRGWLSHFTHADGTPKRYSEVSTIDSALFYGGVLRAAQTLGLGDLEARVRRAVAAVDLDWVMRDGTFLHGFTWESAPAVRYADAGGTAAAAVPAEPRFLPYTWDDTSEGVILYRLFGVPFRPSTHRTDLPLFTYFYPLVLWPEWDAAGSGRPGGAAWESATIEPYRFAGPDYRKLLAAALKWQHSTLGHAGVTAADGPGGYTAFRPTLVSPLMLSSLAPAYREAADTLTAHDLDATQAAYDLAAGWDAPDRLAIDYASYFLLRAVVVEPGRSGGLLADAD